MNNTSETACRVCVVMPTYNNAATLRTAIQNATSVLPNIIVVNDGSTDATAELLKVIPDIEIVTHAHNMGKGAALADGFARALELGFTHAVTMDTDGQHLSSDLPKLLGTIKENPEAMILGVRNLAGSGRRLKSRLLRANSNFWVWVLTGHWVPDTQCGFRIYPLSRIRTLLLKTRRYDFEVEVLVKSMWTGTPVVTIPVGVQYDRGSESHFRPVVDFALVAHLNGCLLAQKIFLPVSLRQAMHLKSFAEGDRLRNSWKLTKASVIEKCSTPSVFAVSIGIGVCLGILPIWGFQIAAAIVVSHQLRLSKALTVTASNISFPAAIPFILLASLLLGRFVLTGHIDRSLSHGELNQVNIWNYAVEYLIGSIILAILAGGVAGILSFALARVLTSRQEVDVHE